MKKIIISILKGIYYKIYLSLSRQAIKILTKGKSLSKEELYFLLRSLPNTTGSIVFQKREICGDREEFSSEIVLDITKPFTSELHGIDNEETYQNFIEALIGEEVIKNGLDAKPTRFYLRDCDRAVYIDNIEQLLAVEKQSERDGKINPNWKKGLNFQKSSLSMNDIGMEMITINQLGGRQYELKSQYIIKWFS